MLNGTALVMMRFDYFNLKLVRLIAALGLCFLYIQFFFWLRISDSLAQYVDLILATYQDMKLFISFLFLFIVMFSTAFFMIELNR